MDPLNVDIKLTVTNPVLLWLFAHGWEDPWWGTVHGQSALALTLADMASVVRQPELARAVRGVAEKLIAEKVAARAG